MKHCITARDCPFLRQLWPCTFHIGNETVEDNLKTHKNSFRLALGGSEYKTNYTILYARTCHLPLALA